MPCFGLTGGIACGKSTAATFLEKKGVRVVDADRIAHHLMEPGAENWQKIVDTFGAKILNSDRTINRRSLAELVFRQPPLRQKLNEITYPAIRQVWLSEKSHFETAFPGKNLVIMIPLLFERELAPHFDATICIGCPSGRQWRHLQDRGLTGEAAQKRLASQWPLDEKMKRADLAVWNSGSFSLLERQMDRLASSLQML
jgi:dephospho-CoA kinase